MCYIGGSSIAPSSNPQATKHSNLQLSNDLIVIMQESACASVPDCVNILEGYGRGSTQALLHAVQEIMGNRMFIRLSLDGRDLDNAGSKNYSM